MKVDQAYRYIKRKIIDGEWASDTAINVNHLATHLNMSRTPVINALNRLEAEGFVQVIPQVGVYVKKPDYHEVYERLLLCSTLEALLTEIAAEKMTTEQLQELEHLLHQMDNPDLSPVQYLELNNQFHYLILKSAGMKYILQQVLQYRDFLAYVGDPDHLFAEERRKQSQAEHWIIYHSIKDRNGRLAKALMENHVGRVIRNILEKYSD